MKMEMEKATLKGLRGLWAQSSKQSTFRICWLSSSTSMDVISNFSASKEDAPKDHGICFHLLIVFCTKVSKTLLTHQFLYICNYTFHEVSWQFCMHLYASTWIFYSS